jgi:hypothetical protein
MGKNLFPRLARVAALSLLVAAPSLLRAQWKTQSIPLVPGWNAVHLQVDPPLRDADDLLAGLPVESAWLWNRTFQPVAFLTDPEELLTGDPNWLIHFPEGSPQAAVKSLFGLKGGECYLIKLGGTRAETWNITGTPVTRDPQWLTDSYNLVGFEVSTTAPPTRASYFSSAPQHQGSQSAYRLSPNGKWQELPDSATLRAGEALWIYSRGSSDFVGPFDLRGSAATFMDFQRNADVLSFDVANRTAESRSYSFRLLPSAAPPIAGDPRVFGPVQLSFFDFDQQADPLGSFVPLTDSVALAVGPEGSREVRLAIERQQMGPIPEDDLSTFQSLLVVGDGSGAEVTVPVRSFAINQSLDLLQPTGEAAAATKAVGKASPAAGVRYAGLWVGSVRVNAVNFPANLPAREQPVPSGGEMEFRVLVHIDKNGKTRLLQQVTLMSKAGAAGAREIVLVTDDSRLGEFEGVVERGGQVIGQRISSTNFPHFREANEPPYALAARQGTFEDGSSATTDTLQFRVALDFDDPLNPFLHAFHPDHDNKDANFVPHAGTAADIDQDGTPDVRVANLTGPESLGIVRDLEFRFSATEPGVKRNGPGWLVDRVGGLYREEIYGLYRSDLSRTPVPIRTPLIVTGTFTLSRLSAVASLNDEVAN